MCECGDELAAFLGGHACECVFVFADGFARDVDFFGCLCLVEVGDGVDVLGGCLFGESVFFEYFFGCCHSHVCCLVVVIFYQLAGDGSRVGGWVESVGFF